MSENTSLQTEEAPPLSSTEDYARFAVEFLSDRLAADIVLIDVTDMCTYTDYFVIATGETDRHLDAMANDLTRQIRKRGMHAGHREGDGRGGWVLVDFPDFIIHLFSKDKRDFYGLDKLWARGTEIVRVQ